MATFFINADTGDNGNDGSSGSPWETLAYAIDQTSVNDVIIAQDSTATYAWNNNTFNFPHALTIQGESDDASGAVFDGGAETIASAVNVTGSYVLEKITLQNAVAVEGGGRARPFLYTYAIDWDMTFNNCAFRDLSVINTGGSGGVAGGDNSIYQNDVTFNGCLFDSWNIKTPGAAGLVFANDSSAASTMIVQGCTIYMTDTDIDTIVAYCNGTFTFRNNIVYHSNTMAWGGAGIDVETVEYNCFYGDTSAFTDIPAGTGNITSDPLFVDPANGNFKLRPASPAIDTGTLI